MTSAQRQLIGVAECLPQLALPRADSPATICWCHGTELAKFIEIQCPECGVPGPEWRLSCPLPLG